MPRGQKSKIRAREKRRQARQTQDMLGSQATAAVAEEPQVSPTPRSKDSLQGSPAAEAPSTPQGPQNAPSPSTPAAVALCPKSDEDTSNQEEESRNPSQVLLTIQQFQKGPIDKKVGMLVYYLLCKYQMKELITKGEMLKNVIQTYRNHYVEILRRASWYLEIVFGLDLKEMDTSKHTYILISKLEASYEEGVNEDRGLPKTGLLLMVLGVIFMHGNCATEEQTWEELNVVGVFPGGKYFIFTNPKQLITKDFVRQRYLEYRQVPNSDPPSYEFLWGPRAHTETSKMKVLEFWAKVCNSVASAFPSQYEEALRDEEERALARAAARARISATAGARPRAMSSSSSCPK